MKTPYTLLDPKGQKLVGVSRTTWYLWDQLRLLSPKSRIPRRNYGSDTELTEALDRFDEVSHV